MLTASRPENAVIDLTKDEDDKELARALQASLEDQGTTKFGPSNRAPDPNWAMVSSNVRDPLSTLRDAAAVLRWLSLHGLRWRRARRVECRRTTRR